MLVLPFHAPGFNKIIIFIEISGILTAFFHHSLLFFLFEDEQFITFFMNPFDLCVFEQALLFGFLEILPDFCSFLNQLRFSFSRSS